MSKATDDAKKRLAERLRIKESDRLKTTMAAINNLRGMVAQLDDGLLIQGVGSLNGGKAEGCTDHRIVMASAGASIIARNDVIVTDSHAIKKSYPDFFGDFKKLGGNVNVINNR